MSIKQHEFPLILTFSDALVQPMFLYLIGSRLHPLVQDKMVNFFVSLTLGLSCLQASMTAPQVYPELISGPGLPSLAELGLTVADLVAIGLPKVETIGKGHQHWHP